MNRSALVRLFGNTAAFVHGDTLVLDRWRWLKRRLPRTRNAEKLIDVGCGTGAFTTGASLRGYHCVGLSWDTRNQTTATERAQLSGVKNIEFPIQDVRTLHERTELIGKYDIAICFETIEHVLDDKKLISDIYACLKPGGLMFLTTPSYFYRPISPREQGPFSEFEDGWHVRRGYTATMIKELCDAAGFKVEEIDYCSGFFSQKVTAIMRIFNKMGIVGWVLTLPLRLLPLLFDNIVRKITGWPNYSIAVVAYRPRF